MILVNFFSSFFLLLAFYNTKKETQMLGKEVKWKKNSMQDDCFSDNSIIWQTDS